MIIAIRCRGVLIVGGFVSLVEMRGDDDDDVD